VGRFFKRLQYGHSIGMEPWLIPEIDFATGRLGRPGNGRELFALPLFDRFGITPIRQLQRFLRRQAQLGQQFSHRRYAKRNTKIPLDQPRHQRPKSTT
jgi:hypothetical protein